MTTDNTTTMECCPSLSGLFRLSSSVSYRFREGNRLSYPPIRLNDPESNARSLFPTNALYTTKYTFWSFFPKLLYEQFRKATSVYFLGICIIASIPPLSPFNPVTSWLGLLFILSVSGIREGYEDYLRLKADMRVNNAPSTTISSGSGELRSKRSYDLKVGDLIFLKSGERVPVDMVLLSSSNEEGTAFIETSQLDGESNLKLRRVASESYHKSDREALSSLSGELLASSPNRDIDLFTGLLNINGEEKSINLNENNLLLAGSFLMNTTWAVGICVYCGPETKLGLNQRLPPSKFSILDKKLNRYILYLFSVKLALCVMLSVLSTIFLQQPEAQQQHLTPVGEPLAFFGFKEFWTYFALLNYLIPLSLVVTLDVVRFVQATFIQWDKQLRYNGHKATAKTSNLNEELALVDYIFTDKTGTLTENVMKFKKASVNGSLYSNNLAEAIQNPLNEQTKYFATHFLYALSLAHSCQIFEVPSTGEITLKSPSPDDEALCQAASENQFVFQRRKGKIVQIKVFDTEEIFEILGELEFTPQRRRMGILLRDQNGRAILYSKGADHVISKQLDMHNNDNVKRLESTREDCKIFSVQGLRTLFIAMRVVPDSSMVQFTEQMERAMISLAKEREEGIERAFSLIETDMTLLGCTGIEDKLQQGVPNTVTNLRLAGVKLWMITGDKPETAINIGFASNLLTTEMDVVDLSSYPNTWALLQDTRKRYILAPENSRKRYALVVEGETLDNIMLKFRADFLSVASYASCVICARTTPLQKADVVSLIQDNLSVVCLAIGDGGNDVSMLQQAHVGVGIKGPEGSQAARAADFAVPQFKCLERLLLIHGRYSLLRNTKVIYQFFYKNVATFMPCVWFAFASGASGMPLYSSWSMLLYNTVYTALPSLSVGLFEKDLREEIIISNPRVYRSHKKLESRPLFHWVTNAIFHSLIIYFGCLGILQELGHTDDLQVFGAFVMFISLHVVLIKILLETGHWVIWTVVSFVLSLGSFYGAELILSSFFPWEVPELYQVFSTLLNLPVTWVTLFLAIPGCLTCDVAFKYFNRNTFPEYWHILQELYASSTTTTPVLLPYSDSNTVPLLEDDTEYEMK